MKQFQLIAAADASVTQTSVECEIGDLTEYGVEVTFSSNTSAGAVTLEASAYSGSNWSTISGSSTAVAAGETVTYSVGDAGYRFFRVKWVPSAGAGTITVYAVVKEPANRF